MADKEYNPFWDAEKWKDAWKKDDKSVWNTVKAQWFPPFVIEPGNVMPTCKVISTSATGVCASFIGFYFPWALVHLAGGAVCDHTYGETAKKAAARQELAAAATDIASNRLGTVLTQSISQINEVKNACVQTVNAACNNALVRIDNHGP